MEKAGPARRRLFPPMLWAGVLGAVVLFVVYSPALNGGLIWDDPLWTTNVASLGLDFQGLAAIWTHPGAIQQYYPVTGTTFWLDQQLWGASTFPLHVENVFLHGLNAL